MVWGLISYQLLRVLKYQTLVVCLLILFSPTPFLQLLGRHSITGLHPELPVLPTVLLDIYSLWIFLMSYSEIFLFLQSFNFLKVYFPYPLEVSQGYSLCLLLSIDNLIITCGPILLCCNHVYHS